MCQTLARHSVQRDFGSGTLNLGASVVHDAACFATWQTDGTTQLTFVFDVAVEVFFDASQFEDLINVAVWKPFSCHHTNRAIMDSIAYSQIGPK